MKKRGICALSTVAVRKRPSNFSSMKSQLLFGETFTLLEEMDDWTHIQCDWDKVEGWISNHQFDEPNEVLNAENAPTCSLELAHAVMADSHVVPILLGSSLPSFDGLSLRMSGKRYTFSGQTIEPKIIKPSPVLIEKIAKKYLYAPYLSGGKTPFGIDAGGFVQMVFKFLGKALPRTPEKQVFEGEIVDFPHQIQIGDIAFFENSRHKIVHVGIVLPDMKIIHSFGQVRIDIIDHYGIYNTTYAHYTHKLRIVKRVLG